MHPQYWAAGRRCAVDMATLKNLGSEEEITFLLAEKGFQMIEIDMITLARERIALSTYRRGARLSEAPEVVDCSGLAKWLYGQRGVWLPRRSIQQREMGKVVDLSDIKAGDLIFTSGRIDYYLDDPADGVGHVGIATNEGTVIHAANRVAGVVESPLNDFAPSGKFRGARRIIPDDHEIITLVTPPEREVETSDDIRWIILQSISKPS